MLCERVIPFQLMDVMLCLFGITLFHFLSTALPEHYKRERYGLQTGHRHNRAGCPFSGEPAVCSPRSRNEL